MIKAIPNTLTSLNLFSGCLAILSLLSGDFQQAVWFFLLAGLFDFSDGLAARVLKAQSPIGKELDSLADMVSFGFAPAIVLYALFVIGLDKSPFPILSEGIYWAATPVFILTIFSALRLAKFNLDERQTENFIGLATPSATLFIVGLLLIRINDSFGLGSLVCQPWFIYSTVALLSCLLVAEIPMFSFKFKSFSWAENSIRYIFAAVSILLLILLREAAFAVIVLLYIFLNLGLLFKSNQT